jgi:hypothetical protein
MSTYHVKSFGELKALYRKHMRARERRLKQAVAKTARQGAAHVRRNVPVAFSDLRDSVHATATAVVADAPHAAAVEQGSRPHFPPIAPIVRWVKLRGMQAQAGDRQLGRMPGTTTAAQARSVGAELERHAIASSPSGQATAIAIDAPTRIAFMIARAIAKRGTRPHWYMRSAVPIVHQFLGANVAAAMPDRD